MRSTPKVGSPTNLTVTNRWISYWSKDPKKWRIKRFVRAQTIKDQRRSVNVEGEGKAKVFQFTLYLYLQRLYLSIWLALQNYYIIHVTLCLSASEPVCLTARLDEESKKKKKKKSTAFVYNTSIVTVN